MSHKNIIKRIKKVALGDTEIKDMKAGRDEEMEESHRPKRGNKVREQYRMRELIEQAKMAVFILIICAMLLAGIFLKLVLSW